PYATTATVRAPAPAPGTAVARTPACRTSASAAPVEGAIRQGLGGKVTGHCPRGRCFSEEHHVQANAPDGCRHDGLGRTARLRCGAWPVHHRSGDGEDEEGPRRQLTGSDRVGTAPRHTFLRPPHRGDDTMRTQTALPTGVLLAAGALLGWVASSGRLTTALAQDKKTDPAPAPTDGTPSVLPRPDFHFKGNVGRTYLDSDKPQFPQPVQAP